MKPSAKIELRTARFSDAAQLRLNWSIAFGDPDDYVRFFFENRFDPDMTPVCIVDGCVVSQLFFLPCELRIKEKQYPVYYLFAAATHPDFRGRGHMTALLRYAEMFAKQRGAFGIVLMPSSDSLYAYYKKFGYEPVFSRRRWIVRREALEKYSEAVSVDPAGSAAFLADYFAKHEGLVWDSSAVTYALREHQLFRGKYTVANGSAFVSIEENTAIIISDPEYLPVGISALLQASEADTFRLLLPPDHSVGEAEHAGMLLYLSDHVPIEQSFLSFTME